MYQYSVILGNVGQCSDRYMTCGYGRTYEIPEPVSYTHLIMITIILLLIVIIVILILRGRNGKKRRW